MKPDQTPRIRDLVVVLLRGCLLAGLLATAAGFLGRKSWALELFSHFRPQFAMGLGLITAVALGLRLWATALISGIGLAVNLAVIAPLWMSPAGPPPGPHRLTILLANVNTANRQFDRFIEVIRARNAEVVGVVETDDGWIAALDAAMPEWPHRLRVGRTDNFGLALYSKPLLAPKQIDLLSVPALTASLDVDGRRLGLLLVHTLPPLSSDYADFRDRAFTEIAGLRPGLGAPAVVMGDFNATPWSPVFADFLAAADLRQSRAGFGVQASWPAPLGMLGIPIDQVLVTQDVVPTTFAVEGEIGSDHRPVYVELAL